MGDQRAAGRAWLWGDVHQMPVTRHQRDIMLYQTIGAVDCAFMELPGGADVQGAHGHSGMAAVETVNRYGFHCALLLNHTHTAVRPDVALRPREISALMSLTQAYAAKSKYMPRPC